MTIKSKNDEIAAILEKEIKSPKLTKILDEFWIKDE